MITKIDRLEAIDKFPNFPLRHFNPKEGEYEFDYPKMYSNYVLTLPSKSYKGHIKLLGEQLVYLLNKIESDNMIFLGDEDVPWLRRLKTYEVFQEALQYLVVNKINKRFNGALQVDIEEIPIFIKHLAWLVRTNGILPYVHFIDPGQKFILNICQYGNLHVSTMNKRANKKFLDVIAESRFTFLTDSSCYNKFSKRSAIKGRTILV